MSGRQLCQHWHSSGGSADNKPLSHSPRRRAGAAAAKQGRARLAARGVAGVVHGWDLLLTSGGAIALLCTAPHALAAPNPPARRPTLQVTHGRTAEGQVSQVSVLPHGSAGRSLLIAGGFPTPGVQQPQACHHLAPLLQPCSACNAACRLQPGQVQAHHAGRVKVPQAEDPRPLEQEARQCA